MDNLIRLQQEIIDGFSQRQYTACVFFDVEKAFDRISPSVIIEILCKWNIGGNILKFVQLFLNDRTFSVRLGNILSIKRKQEVGTPQGSVLSPLLFSIALSEIQKIIKFPVNYSLYADDLVIYMRNSNTEIIEKQLQNTITQLAGWIQELGLRFSTTKTKTLLFHRKHGTVHPLNLKLYNSNIEDTNETRFLGLIFDSRMS